MQRIAVIGQGMSALCLLHELKKDGLHRDFSLDVFAPQSLLKDCSTTSTALVSAYGVRPEISPLGDIFHTSIALSSKFYGQSSLPGIESIQHLQLATPERLDSLRSRFAHQRRLINRESSHLNFLQEVPSFWVVEDSFLITPELFLPAWRTQLTSELSLKWFSEVVHAIEPDQMTVKTAQQTLSYDRIFICAGAYRSLLNLSAEVKSRAVTGHTFYWRDQDLGPVSFALGIDGKNMIYRSQTREVFLGGTANLDSHQGINFDQLDQQWKKFGTWLSPELFQRLHSRPPSIYGGPREKAPKRLPYARPLPGYESKIMILGGHYKNGYSTAFYTAQQAYHWLKVQ